MMFNKIKLAEVQRGLGRNVSIGFCKKQNQFIQYHHSQHSLNI